MSLECLVKISSVNNLSDARYAAGMGIELMGFDLDPNSENFISPEQFSAITSWVSGVKFVGEIGSFSAEVVKKLIETYQVDYLQVGSNTDLSSLKELPLPVVVKIDLGGKQQISEVLEKFNEQPAWYLLEPETDLSPEVLEWCAAQASEYPLLLGSNLTAENVHEMLQAGFSGIALRGGHEIRPGYKDFDELADILEALEVID